MEAAPLRASPCTLAWDQCQDSMVSGYALYYGVRSSTTTNRLDVGMTNQAAFKDLLASSNYFFYITAYNVDGIESSPSTVMYYTPKVLSALKLIPLTNGTINVRFLAATGAVCHVEYTPILSPPQWQTLGSATADADGSVTLTDSSVGNSPTRFYRTAVP